MLNQLRVWMMVAVITALSATAQAQDWGQVVNVSATMGISGNRLCYGEGSRGDIGCPADAPVISGSTITGTFVGNGSGLTGVTAATADRIVSGTTNVTVNNSASTIFTNGGSQTMVIQSNGYVGIGTAAPTSQLQFNAVGLQPFYFTRTGFPTKFGIRVTTNGTQDAFSFGSFNYPNSLVITSDSTVGIGATLPSTTLDVNGSIRMGMETSTTLNTCDTGRKGAIRYNGNTFQVCYGTGGWANLADTSSTVATADRITSGTAQVIANGTTNSISITESGVTTGYYYNGVWVAGGVSATGRVSATSAYLSGNLGIGVPSSNYAIDVSTSASTNDGLRIRLWNATSNNILIAYSGAILTHNWYVTNGNNAVMALWGNNVENIRLNTATGANSWISNGGNLGIGSNAPSTTLHVNGSIRIAQETSTTLNTCDTNRSGAIRYTGGTFQVCYGTGGWANLADASSTVATADRITSGTAQVIANGASGYVSLTSGASTWGYLGVSQTYLGATNFGGKVGIGTITPAAALEVSGTVSATVLQLADGPALTCGPGVYGTMKMVNGRPYYCRQ